MMQFATRYLPVIAISLLLAACQSKPQVASLPTDDLVTRFRQLDLSLNNGQLADAETQLRISSNAPPATPAWSSTSASSPKPG